MTGVKVEATQIFLSTEKEVYGSVDSFYVPVRIDTQGECVNAVSVAVAYNPEILSVKDVATGKSIIPLWVSSPIVERVDGKEVGRVTFEGGIPGGYCGRVFGDPGTTDILVELVVTGAPQLLVNKEDVLGKMVIEPESRAYLHDGTGSPSALTFLGVEFTVTQATSTAENEWLSDVRSDTIAPEYFEIEFVEGPSIGNKKHYIVFNTTDKQSGISHYEVLETDPDRFGLLTWLPKESYWVEAKSPFVLRDQKLRSKIMVKAVDKNGNERIVTYTPPMTPLDELANLSGILAFIIIPLLFLVVVFFLLRYRRRVEVVQKNKDESYEN